MTGPDAWFTHSSFVDLRTRPKVSPCWCGIQGWGYDGGLRGMAESE